MGGQTIVQRYRADNAAEQIGISTEGCENLTSLLLEQAQIRPHAPALIDDSGGKRRVMSFGELAQASAQAVSLLAQRGLQPGDKVLLFHPMSAELYVALAAIFRLGLVALFIDPGMGRAHIDRCCAHVPPQALLATPKAHLLRMLSPHLRRIPVKFATGWGAPGATRWARYTQLQPATTFYPADADTPALATFTSGSTGAPKLAVRTHGFLRHQHEVLDKTLALQPQTATGEDTRVLTTLPIFVLSHLAAGVCTLIPRGDIRRPGAVKAEPILQSIASDRVTCLAGSPAFLGRLATAAAHKQRTFPHVTKVFTGGAPVFPTLLDGLQRMTPQAQVTAVYGSTEAEPIAHIAHAELTPADRAAMYQGGGLLTGAPVPEIRVRILPDRWGTSLGSYTAQEFDGQALAATEIGEIVVSGGHVLPGYWQGAGDAESKIRVLDENEESGAVTIWHRTGDAGYMDAQGRLWLLGRCSARIQDAHGSIYPFAVECAAHELPGVRLAALIQLHGRRVLAVAGTLSTAERASLHRELAWAQIDDVRVLDHLPVDPRHNAKIDYAGLRKQLGGAA